MVLYRLEAAKSDIKSAEILLKAGEYRGANNRAYYGIYHAVSAIHALELIAMIENYLKEYHHVQNCLMQ